jgi:hypothetical protein
VIQVEWSRRLAEVGKHLVSWPLVFVLASIVAMIPFSIGCATSPMAGHTPSLVDTPRLEVTPSSVNFSSAIVGAQTSQSLKLSNTGETALTVTGVIANGTGLSISGFSGSTLLNPGTSSTLTVNFTPKTAGTFAGSVSVLTNTAAVTAALPVTGDVASAKLAISVGPSSLNFGTVSAGRSVSQSVTLTNTGNTDVTISSVRVSGAAFGLTGWSAPAQLSSSQSITVDVQFDPKASGTYSGSLMVSSDAGNSSVAVPLSGAVAPTLTAPNATHSVSLTWDASSSKVSGYNVYRGGVSEGPFTRLNGSLVSELNFTDATVTAGATYYYVTTAVDSSGIESVYSNTARAIVP